MSAIQEEEIKQGRALTTCRTNVIWYGLRSGWCSDKLKFSTDHIPRDLPAREQKAIRRSFALYSFCYDAGEAGHRLWATPTMQAVARIIAYGAVAALLGWLGLSALGVPPF